MLSYRGEELIKPQFFPAFASTDVIAYKDHNGYRKTMSIRRLLPPEIQKRFLISLYFDESIHYKTSINDGDLNGLKSINNHPLKNIETVFVDCGAFHYSRLEIPKFRNGLYVTAKEAWNQYLRRHLKSNKDILYLLCAPDHIITSDQEEEEVKKKISDTLISAQEFINLFPNEYNCEPVAVVHGRNKEERAEMTRKLLEMGYKYLAIGGLVPLSNKTKVVLEQVAGIKNIKFPVISQDSPLGIIKKHGAKIHMLGLNSPDWYQWWLRLGVDSFDGSKLSQEGAAMGQIWSESNQSLLFGKYTSGKSMYERIAIKKMYPIGWNEEVPAKLIFHPETKHPREIYEGIGNYFQNSTCTRENCLDKHRNMRAPNNHNQDPRCGGSIDHNMARTIINFHVYSKLMKRMDELFTERDENGKPYPSWEKVQIGD